MMYNLLLSSLVLTLGSACWACSAPKPVEKSTTNSRSGALAFAKSTFGGQSEVLPNADSTFFLCRISDEVFTEFMVTDRQNQIILNQQRVKGIVKWHSKSSLAITNYPGALEDRRSDPADLIEVIELKKAH